MRDSAEIVVIGAGIAGLAAARRLAGAGRTVEVLEARERLGGRISTEIMGDVPIDLGASWIHGSHGNPLAELATRFRIPTVAFHHQGRALDDRDGEPRPASALDDRAAFYSALRRAREKLDEDLPLDRALFEAAAGSPERFDSYRYRLRWLALIMGAEAHCLSARHWDQDDELGGEDLVFPGGFGSVVEELSSGISVTTNCSVTGVSWSDDRVTVCTTKGELSARAAIVTLPLGVLKENRVAFDPPLPEPTRGAIERLGMGVLNKIVLRYDSQFWPDIEHFARADAGPDECFGYSSLARSLKKPILVAWSAGDQARRLEQWDDDKVQDWALEGLERLFGGVARRLDGFRITRWASDPFARGAYSHIPVGASGKDYETLARPVSERLILAGEATSRAHPATTHGAYLSGVRAAESWLFGVAM